jgi:hypothetical protein
MAIDKEQLRRRIDELLALKDDSAREVPYDTVVEAMHGALTVARVLYGDGEETPQVHTIMKSAQQARADETAPFRTFPAMVWPVVKGSLRAMRADVDAGLVGTVERRAIGEVIADMLGLAKEALGYGEKSRNVAAVLTAAAFEDTIRKMGATLANVQGRPDLADVLTALKTAKVIVGAPLTTAQGYLKFRNDALHADWANLDQATVSSCLAFTEGLLMQHFS